MRLSLRFVVPLGIALAAIAYAVVPLVDRLTFQWFVRDLDSRGALIAQAAQEPLAELLASPRNARARVLRYFERLQARCPDAFTLETIPAKGDAWYGPSVFRSDDDGATWSQSSRGMTYGDDEPNSTTRFRR